MLKKIILFVLPVFLLLLILFPNVINKYGYFPLEIILREISSLEPPNFSHYLDSFRDLIDVVVNFANNFYLPDFSNINSIFDIPTVIASYGFAIADFIINIFGSLLNIIISTVKLFIEMINYPLDIIEKFIFIFR